MNPNYKTSGLKECPPRWPLSSFCNSSWDIESAIASAKSTSMGAGGGETGLSGGPNKIINQLRDDNYSRMYEYLSKNNDGYIKMLGKFLNPLENKFQYTIGTDASKIPPAGEGEPPFGGYTSYEYNFKESGEKGKEVYTLTSATARSDFDPENRNGDLTIWHIYIMIHEAAHAAVVFELNKWYKQRIFLPSHGDFMTLRNKIMAAFVEVNVDLNLGLSEYDLNVLLYSGAERTRDFKQFIDKEAATNKTNADIEKELYAKRKQELFQIKININD